MIKSIFAFITASSVFFPLMASELDPTKLKQSDPVAYSHDEDVTISRRYIKADEIGVISTAESDVTLSECYIVAGKHGIKCMGQGDVYIRNCYVEGHDSALYVGGQGDVYASGSTFAGRLVVKGVGADYHNEGGNVFFADAKEPLKKLAAFTKKYIQNINKAKDATAVAAAMNQYIGNMTKVIPGIVKIQNKYPELKHKAKHPKALRPLMKKIAKTLQNLMIASKEAKKYAQDPVVQEVTLKYKEVMSAVKWLR